MRARRWMMVVLVAATVATTGACGDRPDGWWLHDDRPADDSGDPFDGDGDHGNLDHVVTGAVNGRGEVEFVLVSGAGSVSVTSVDLGDTLYRISTPDGSSFYPAVVDDGPHVQLHLKKKGDDGPDAVQVQLNSRVRWALRFDGGVTTNLIDMTGGKVSAVAVTAGVTRLDLRLPAPTGTVPVRLGGGASEFSVSVPAGTPARVRVGNGVGTAVIDGDTRSGVPAGTTFPAAGYESTMDRYDVDLATGVSTLRLDHR